MDTEKVAVVEQLSSTVTSRVESLGEGLKVTANVTQYNGVVSSIDSIRVTDPSSSPDEEMPGNIVLWEGYASPNVGGNFYSSGREIEVLSAVMEFINAVRNV